MAGLQHSSTRARVCYRSSSSGWQRATCRAKASCMFWKLKISKGKALSFLWFLLVTVWVNSDQLSCIFSSHASSVAPGLQTWLCRCATLVRTEISQQLWIPQTPLQEESKLFRWSPQPYCEDICISKWNILSAIGWTAMEDYEYSSFPKAESFQLWWSPNFSCSAMGE